MRTIYKIVAAMLPALMIGCSAPRSSVTIDPTSSDAGSRTTEIEYGAKPEPVAASVDVVVPASAAEQTIRVTFTNGEFDAQFIKPPVPLPPPAPPAGPKPAPGPAPK